MHNNPYVDLIKEYSSYLCPFDCDPKPFIDGRGQGELFVELGCGSGNFLVALAEMNPENFYVGVELRFKRLVLLARKADKRGLKNVFAVQGRIQDIGTWLGQGTVSGFYCNFPDPWPKNKHVKHRFLNHETLITMSKLICHGGELKFRTDDGNYFDWVMENIRASRVWNTVFHTRNFTESEYYDPVVSSEFEKLFISKGTPIKFLIVKHQ